MTKRSNTIIVKLTLNFQDTGLEQICSHLLAEPTTFSRTRLFNDLVLQSWRGALPPLPHPYRRGRKELGHP